MEPKTTWRPLAAAWAVNLAFDCLSRAVPALSPPHLLMRYAPDFASQMASPLSMALAASFVLSALGVLLLSLVPPGTPRPEVRLTAWFFSFFAVTEGLFALAWLSAPAGLLAGSLLFGLVRSAAVAWVLVRSRRDRYNRRP